MATSPNHVVRAGHSDPMPSKPGRANRDLVPSGEMLPNSGQIGWQVSLLVVKDAESHIQQFDGCSQQQHRSLPHRQSVIDRIAYPLLWLRPKPTVSGEELV